jgi:hypothetical protein
MTDIRLALVRGAFYSRVPRRVRPSKGRVFLLTMFADASHNK